MLATDLSNQEFDELLVSGWRRFGIYFFRPMCESCKACIPIRVPVASFNPSKSQKRVLKKNTNTKVIFRELSYWDDIYNVYKDHSKRFGQDTSVENFKQTFFSPAVPAFQTEYYVDEKLAAIGFVDLGIDGISSVYFVFREEYSYLSLGTFGALQEIEIVRNLGMKYYYLGYYLKDNKHMKYKALFKPYQLYDWDSELWITQGP
jgi:arginine-tRNA-protein transferase